MSNEKLERINWKSEWKKTYEMYLNQRKTTRRVLDGWERTLNNFKEYLNMSIIFALGFLILGFGLGLLIGGGLK